MKKDAVRAIITAAVALILYVIIAFAVPFAHTAAFWLSFVFTLIAFGVVGASVYIAFFKSPDAKSRFYGFPIARIGVIYGIAQLIVGLAVMTLAMWVPAWAAIIVYAVGLGAAVIGLVGADAVVSEIQTQDTKLKANVSLMRSLQSKIGHISTLTDAAEVKALADEFRFSDPVSSEALGEIEAELETMVDLLNAAVTSENTEEIGKICKKITATLGERNRLCKLSK